MKKKHFYVAACALLAWGSAKSASAQSNPNVVCTAGSSTVCSQRGHDDGAARSASLCGSANQAERDRIGQDYWNRAQQAQSAGRWDDYAYLSGYSDEMGSTSGCPYGYEAHPAKKTATAAQTTAASK